VRGVYKRGGSDPGFRVPGPLGVLGATPARRDAPEEENGEAGMQSGFKLELRLDR